jgi:hypothetical protein
VAERAEGGCVLHVGGDCAPHWIDLMSRLYREEADRG